MMVCSRSLQAVGVSLLPSNVFSEENLCQLQELFVVTARKFLQVFRLQQGLDESEQLIFLPLIGCWDVLGDFHCCSGRSRSADPLRGEFFARVQGDVRRGVRELSRIQGSGCLWGAVGRGTCPSWLVSSQLGPLLFCLVLS